MRNLFQYIGLTVVIWLMALSTSAQSWDMGVAADSTLRMDSTLFANSPEQLYRYYFLESVVQQNRGNHDEAFALLRRCIDMNPEAAEGYFQISGYYVDQKNDSMARYCLERAAELQPKNNTYVERLGQFYINQAEYGHATEVYEQLYASNKSRADIVELLYRLYYVQENSDKMLEQLNRLELIEGSSEQISLSKMQIYAAQGKRSKQLDELKRLSDSHPNDLNYKVMMGNWLLQNDKPKEALALFKAVLKEDPQNASAQLSMLDYYRHIGQNNSADIVLRQLLKSAKTPKETKLALLRQTVTHNRDANTDDPTKTVALIDDVLKEEQEDADIYMFKAAYMALHEMPTDDIDAVYEQALAVEPDNSSARWMLISSYWKKEDWDKMIELSKPAQEYNPNEMLFYYSQGIAEYQKQDEDAALATFRKGVTQINQDSDAALASDFYAIMGDILHNKGMDAEAFVAYDSCLVYKSDNITALNNYAYYLCLKDSALNKAEEMSRKAITAEPENATYLDTYAWILFMQGKYADAQTYIEQAIAADTTLNSVVKEHTGDIYAMNGNLEKALNYWQQALSSDQNNAILQEKIKQKRYIKQ